MGDCVELLLAGSGKEEASKGYGEILWIWRAAPSREKEEEVGGWVGRNLPS